MTRRITRTLGQAALFITAVFILVFVADYQYKVLPTSIHSFSPTHHAGSVITDITLSFCSSANPFSTCRLDPDKWHRIEKDLYLQTGWVKSAWLHVQRKKEEELLAEDKVVVGVRVGRLDPGVGEAGQAGERWESRPGGIWLLRSNKRHDSDSEKAITAVDVLFGADAVDPRPNWVLARTPLLLNAGKDVQIARLSTRNGPAKKEEKDAVPRIRKDGKFKILQISDAHLSTGTGVCRDAIEEGNRSSTKCEADPRTLEFIGSVLDDETPDLVVLSGDQVEGPAAPDTQSAIFKFADPLIERSIPYATIFGNHDDEGPKSLSRRAQMSLIQTLPFSLSQPGPETLDGVGNYHIEVLAHSGQHSALTLYMLDTHGLTPDEKKYRGYNWLKQGQIDWFKSTSQGLKKEHKKYSHIHLDMAFIHIPLPEYADKENIVTGGQWKEGVTAPAFNSHFYDALVEEGIVAVGCGHDHVNDYCAIRPSSEPAVAARTEPVESLPLHDATSIPEDPQHITHGKKKRLGPWMCYAGASGFGGYAGYGGFHRRVRVWEVDTNAGRVVTWKRVECCGEETEKRIDELTIVESGVVVASQVKS
ncbi:Metallo-dependent phosphatase [Teratosphaeria nubilosa]|uniref:Metallo-dependent phosphatase n=1 Tax=Teratosphaeria nubilosa TaxID=161662 RepID=A0A6G1LBL9_9PEZI|nr:Metallo-dependent phosphatase [Teratosphaeria nubilosa]